MVSWIVGIFVCILVVSLLANAIEDYNNTRVIPFCESYKRVRLPLIVLRNNNKDFNFLVDTGSNLSLIDLSILEELVYEKSANTGTIFGMEGNQQNVSYANIVLSDTKTNFSTEFQVVNLSGAFNKVAEMCGTRIHGVLGNDFLEYNRCKINYEKLHMKYDLSGN